MQLHFARTGQCGISKKIARAFDKHTQEIKADLERGTALPEH